MRARTPIDRALEVDLEDDDGDLAMCDRCEMVGPEECIVYDEDGKGRCPVCLYEDTFA